MAAPSPAINVTIEARGGDAVNISKLAFGFAAFAVCLPLAERAAAQCDCVVAEPCTITTNIADFASGAERTTCAVRTAAGFFSVAYNLTTVSGRQYRIENPLTGFDGWFINGTPGVRVAGDDAAQSCYRTIKVQICFGR